MLLEILTLANTPASDPLDKILPWVTSFVLAVIAAVFKVQADRAKKVTLENQPLHIRLEDQFVTRREFDAFKSEIRVDVTEMKGLFRETMLKIDERDARLSAKIEAAAKTGVDGRVAIWNQIRDDKKDAAEALKEQGERIAKVEAGVDIAQRFERVATEAFKKPNGRA